MKVKVAVDTSGIKKGDNTMGIMPLQWNSLLQDGELVVLTFNVAQRNGERVQVSRKIIHEVS